MDFNVELNMLVDFVRRYPQQSATHMLQTRRAVFGKFPFAIIYRDMLDEIQIIAVAHTSRRPGYWRRRSF